MFNKSEESEWTRFSRALGGSPAAPAEHEASTADGPDEAVTLAQSPPVEPEVYLAPTTSADEPAESDQPAFVAPRPTVAAPALTQAATPEQGESVIGDGASLEGTVRSDGPIRVRGTVQGEIESKQRVVVEESAKVAARIVAENVTVLGEVNGSIECAGRLEIASSARVTGEVTASTLVIQEGAFFEGNLKMSATREGA